MRRAVQLAAVAREPPGDSLMRFLLLSEGVVALVASIASYLWGYRDGRADLRAVLRNALKEVREAD